ncbi:hypothetical protein [Streptomyces chryseus]|uniref:hypothetical protein n=1 Tax=Streptomyces chryseus TaxID=68186 RepID=UPI00110FC139|nr:hypothetical protein [Streptomyces chryseus]GGX40822.1 hypothetical protein GCM10010353_65220 [Streptomyces chryseus]
MTLWLKARRIPLLAVGLALYAGVAIAAGSLTANLPTLTSSGAAGVPLMLFAPLPACAALIFCLESGSPGAEGTASRRVARYDQVVIVLSGVVALTIGYGTAVLRSAPVAEAAGRNMLFLTGIMLCARWLWDGRIGVLAGIAWVIMVTLIGFNARREPYTWAVIGLPPHDIAGMALSLTCFTLGALLLASRKKSKTVSG